MRKCRVGVISESAGCGRLKKVRDAGGFTKCGVQEVEKSAGCGRLIEAQGAGG